VKQLGAALALALPAAPVVSEEEIGPAYTVGAVLPASTPLFAVPQDLALRVPAIQRYSYAYLGGRTYLVDPMSGVIVEDFTE